MLFIGNELIAKVLGCLRLKRSAWKTACQLSWKFWNLFWWRNLAKMSAGWGVTSETRGPAVGSLLCAPWSLRVPLLLPKTPSLKVSFGKLQMSDRGGVWWLHSCACISKGRNVKNVFLFPLPLLWAGCRECYSADGWPVARWKANQNKLGNKETSGSKEYLRMWVCSAGPSANLPPHTWGGKLWNPHIWRWGEKRQWVLKQQELLNTFKTPE